MARPKKDSTIAATQLKSAELVDKSDLPREHKEPRNMRDFLGIAAEVAQDTIYTRNTRLPDGMKIFPHEPFFRTIDKFFPFAVGGPLYLDEPTDLKSINACKLKAESMHKQGLRYAYITDDMDLDDVLRQLNEAPAYGVA